MANAERTESSILASGLALLFLTFIAWEPLQIVGSDFLLRVGGAYTAGQIVAAEESIEDSDEGRSMWFHSAEYKFTTLDGEEVHGVAHGSGRLRPALQQFDGPVPVVVEYLPRYPSVSRMREVKEPQAWGRVIFRAVLAAGFIAWWVVLIVTLVRRLVRRSYGVAL
jgi:hypothetical protein